MAIPTQKMPSLTQLAKVFQLLFFTFLLETTFSQVAITNFPKSKQIFQRDASDSATIVLDGFINTAGAKAAVILIKKNNILEKTISYSPKSTGLTSFSIPIKLKAGAFNYSLESSIDGRIPLFTATEILVGDVFVFYGQSNAIGLGPDIDKYLTPTADPFMRTFYADLPNKNGVWQNIDFASAYKVGMFPIELMRKYREQSNYPVGVIQAGHGGTDLSVLNLRNQENPFDLNTKYGELLTRLSWAGLKENIKYFVFRQGENEAIYEEQTADYPNRFATLIKNLNKDLPTITHFYNYQLNILSNELTQNPNSEVLRNG